MSGFSRLPHSAGDSLISSKDIEDASRNNGDDFMSSALNNQLRQTPTDPVSVLKDGTGAEPRPEREGDFDNEAKFIKSPVAHALREHIKKWPLQ